MVLSRSRIAVGLAAALVLTLALVTLVLHRPAVGENPLLADEPLAAPGDWFDSQRAIGDDRHAYARAVAAAADVAEQTARVAPEVAELEWEHMGPTNFGGRIADIAVDVDELNTVWIATASGGVWQSTDAGTTFSRAWPDELTQATGAIAMGGDGVLYVGTGESNPGGGSLTYGGTGLYRSADRGETWELVGLETSGSFGRIIVDPDDPQRVFAAATGNLFVPGGERGLYRSLDGGDTWELVLEGANPTTGAVDVEMDPSDPDHLIAATWDRVRTPDARIYAGEGSAVYRSTDGGDTWTQVSDVSMNDPGDNGRIGVAFAPSDSSRVYAVIASTLNGRFGGMYRSDDGGASFTELANPAFLAGNLSTFGWWFGRIWVDPVNPDRLFVGGVELMDSHDGGETFLPQSNTLVGVATGAHNVSVHADQQAMAWHPTIPGRLYLGNDGGFYRSDANGTPGTWVFAVEQGWTQHYSVDVGEQTPDYIVSGLQDNMCQRNSVAGGAGTPATWTKFGLCGDGLQTLINPEDETITYGCSQYGGCGRQRAGVIDPTFGNRPGQRSGWFAPLEFDPNDPSVMYFGRNVLSRTTNGGTSWTQISPDLTRDGEQQDPHAGYRIRHVLTAVAVAKSDPDVLYVGTDDGLLWTTKDLGETWVQLEDETLPDAWVTRVAVDPADADIAYATFSGYRSGDDTPHVVRTTDGGQTWTNISGNLPPAAVNDIVVIGDALAVATDVAVYLTRDLGETWVTVGANMPTVPVLDLRYHEPTNTLTAATFGHGIQRVSLP